MMRFLIWQPHTSTQDNQAGSAPLRKRLMKTKGKRLLGARDHGPALLEAKRLCNADWLSAVLGDGGQQTSSFATAGDTTADIRLAKNVPTAGDSGGLTGMSG